jgi:glycerophosphoryl diester phosphodiesterase
MSFWDNFGDKKNLVAAHRGARSLKPENTMSAFKEALDKSDYIELDVGFSKDGVAIIIHDDTLERTSNVKEVNRFKKPYNVLDYNYEELLELNFGEGEKLPTLKEVLLFLKTHNFPVNVEMKDMRGTKFDKIITQRVIDIVKETKMENLVLFSSFNHTYLKEAYKKAPHITRAALQEKKHPENILEYLKSLHVKSYNPELKIADLNLVRELSDAGIFVNVFTVNKEKDKIALFRNGAKSVFTDII